MTASVVLRGGCMMTWWSTGSTPKLEGEGEGREETDGIGNRKTRTKTATACSLPMHHLILQLECCRHHSSGGRVTLDKKRSKRG